MIQIRQSTFETNSSSTHSMVIVPESMKEDTWLYYDTVISEEEKSKMILKDLQEYNSDIYPDKPVSNNLPDLELYKLLREAGYLYELSTLNDWLNDDSDLDITSENYTTPKGEKLTIYCKYGYDG